MKPEDDFENVYELVEYAIDCAFEGKMALRFYDFLKSRKTKKHEVDSFIQSSTAHELSMLVLDLEGYIKGGKDSDHKQLREGYGHIPKPKARKIKEYLYSILDDAWMYSRDRRPGRRKKGSK